MFISSSLSSVSSSEKLCSSITIILHALNTRYKQKKVHHRKKLCNKKHSYQNESSSSSSISLPQLINKKKTKHSSNKLINNGLNSNRYSASSLSSECDKVVYNKSDQIFEEEKTTSFFSQNSLSNSIPDLNNLNLTEPDDENYHQTGISTVGTQTDNHSYIRQEYQYGNLRRVNSDLLDYIFLPISK